LDPLNLPSGDQLVSRCTDDEFPKFFGREDCIPLRLRGYDINFFVCFVKQPKLRDSIAGFAGWIDF